MSKQKSKCLLSENVDRKVSNLVDDRTRLRSENSDSEHLISFFCNNALSSSCLSDSNIYISLKFHEMHLSYKVYMHTSTGLQTLRLDQLTYIFSIINIYLFVVCFMYLSYYPPPPTSPHTKSIANTTRDLQPNDFAYIKKEKE